MVMLYCSQQCHVILVRLFSYIGNAPASIVWRKMLNILRPTETPGSLFCRHYQIYYLHWQRLYRDSNSKGPINSFSILIKPMACSPIGDKSLPEAMMTQDPSSLMLICACPRLHLSRMWWSFRLIPQLIKRCMDCVPFIFSNITVDWHAVQLPPNQKPC